MRALKSLVALLVVGIALPTYAQMIIYPAKGQTAAQQQKDEGECTVWAKQNTGVDPAAVAQAQASQPAPSGPQGERVRGAARGALAGAAVGAIAGDAGKGAAIGAAGERSRVVLASVVTRARKSRRLSKRRRNRSRRSRRTTAHTAPASKDAATRSSRRASSASRAASVEFATCVARGQ